MPRVAIGSFKIDHDLGHNGMRPVFVVADTRMDRRIAIQTLCDQRAGRYDWASVSDPEFPGGEQLAARLATVPIPVT